MSDNRALIPKEKQNAATPLDLWDRGAACAGRGKVDAIVCKDRVDLVRHGGNQVARKSAATRVVAFSCSSTKANFEVRSIATKR
jgi:hypothetical protein